MPRGRRRRIGLRGGGRVRRGSWSGGRGRGVRWGFGGREERGDGAVCRCVERA